MPTFGAHNLASKIYIYLGATGKATRHIQAASFQQRLDHNRVPTSLHSILDLALVVRQEFLSNGCAVTGINNAIDPVFPHPLSVLLEEAMISFLDDYAKIGLMWGSDTPFKLVINYLEPDDDRVGKGVFKTQVIIIIEDGCPTAERLGSHMIWEKVQSMAMALQDEHA